MENEKINIVIVDDHPIVIEGLRLMLNSQPVFNVAGSFATGAETVSFIQSEKADIVLLDITLPDSSGTELCREIKKISPGISVIMFSNRSERSIIMQCIQNGASGYLLKNTSLDDLVLSIRGALSGDIVFCNETKQIISRPTQKDIPVPRVTKREKQSLKMVAQGKTSNMIAEELFLSPLTVDTHRKNLLQKFQARNSTELITLAVQLQLIEE